MNRLLKVPLIAAASAVLASSAGFVAYDLAVFQSRRAQIGVLLSQASNDERFASPRLLALVRADTGDPSGQAARILVTDLPVTPIGAGQMGRHLTGVLWRALVALHLSEQEQVALIASRSSMGQGQVGYSAAAHHYFGKPLAQLSLEETASLVAIAWAPGAYLHAPDRQARRRELLLRRVAQAARRE
jgi:hypothetical protein